MPTFSIIMPNYNYGNFITESIDSILKQSYKNWELIIIDNGSNDDSIKIIKEYTAQNRNIHLYQHENSENRGLVASLKLGLSKAKGEYLAFLESDDLWDSNYLEEKYKVFKKYPNVNFIFNDILEFGDKNRINTLSNHLNSCRNFCENTKWPTDISHRIASLNIVITFSAVCFKKENFEKCDFTMPIDPHIDWWFIPQITTQGESFYINKKLTKYRIHMKSYSNSTQKKYPRAQSKVFLEKLFRVLRKQNKIKYQKTMIKSLIEKMFYQKINILSLNKTDFIKSLKSKKIYLYGAGIFAEEIIAHYDISALNISGFIDASTTKAGKTLGGYKIFHKDEIPELKPDVIILCVANPDLIYYNLLGWLLEKNTVSIIVSDFFDEFQYKNILEKENISLEQTLSEILL
ncbi:MAG: glycosyltransferase [Candidatus Gastranaerophilales bacterium]|nr:glycosyltransferase [Candidatus Gastranaerophilales bacterium]